MTRYFLFYTARKFELLLMKESPIKKGVMKRAACCRPRKRQPSTSTINQTALFSIAVDQTALFYWLTFLNFSWSTSTRLHFSSLSMVHARQRRSTSISQPFSLHPNETIVDNNYVKHRDTKDYYVILTIIFK